MPDGDVIPGLRRLYRLPYQELIEGKATDEQCIHSLLDALKRDLKCKGNIPIKLAQDMWKKLSSVINPFGQINADQYAKLSLEFDRLIQYSDGMIYLKELVLRAGKTVLLNIKYGTSLEISYGPHIIVKQYMIEVFEKEFNQATPLTATANADIKVLDLQQRLTAIRPKILGTLEKWAIKADAANSIHKIRMPNRQILQEIDLEEDLLAGGTV